MPLNNSFAAGDQLTATILEAISDEVDKNTPPGVIHMYGAASAPTGWLLCDGTAVSRVTYADLFAIISTNYGVGDGSTTFNLPDFRGRGPMGKNSGTFSALGGTGGEETHTLTVNEMPAHDHDWSNSAGGGGGSGVVPANSGSGGGAIEAPDAGGGAAHNVLDPYLVVTFIIKI